MPIAIINFLSQKAQQLGAEVVSFSSATVTDCNRAAARAIAIDFGLTTSEIERGLAAYTPLEQRLKLIKSKKFPQLTILDDSYNSNPDALRFAIESLKEQAGSARKLALLGDMLELGDRREELHRAVDTEGLDLVITYGDLAQYIKHDFHFAIGQQAELLHKLSKLIKPGDLLLVKGSRSLKMESFVAALS